MFIHQEEDINRTFEHLHDATPQAAWDNLAPGTEKAQKLVQDEGVSNERPMAEEDNQTQIDQIVKEVPQS